MEETIKQLFEANPAVSVLLSISLGIFIAISGILPSYFLTAANIGFFGFINGTLISFAGEALGAWIAFLIYRKGLKEPISKRLKSYPRLKKLVDAERGQAFRLVIYLRLIPFVPSGLITLAAAAGSIPVSLFVLASSLGKIPAIILEAFAMYGILRTPLAGYILGILALVLLFIAVRNVQNNKR